jgi:hypothetical protein
METIREEKWVKMESSIREVAGDIQSTLYASLKASQRNPFFIINIH